MKTLRRTLIPLSFFLLIFAGCQPDEPDLQVTLAATDGATYSPGDDIAGTLSLEVQNTGNAPAQGTEDDGGYMVDLVLSEDSSVPVTFATVPSPYEFQEDMLLEGGRISNTTTVDGGATQAYDDKVLGIIPPDAPSSVYLCAVVDPDNQVAESNEDNNTSCIEIEITPPSVACVTFENQAGGTQYGPPAQASGDLIFTQNRIDVRVTDFNFTGTGGTFDNARIDASNPSFGVGSQFLSIDNINLLLDFSGLFFTPSRVTFQFVDFGGFENLGVNGSPSPIYAGELTAAPSPIGGVSVSTGPQTSVTGGYTSDATLSGSVTELIVGGQEFGIDEICAHP